ncbi:MAG: sodium-dependent transporter [Victivallales bacterium]|jgi:NSS family neurotransmitter:Na+ symporter|nr:sodium-dependent transporter [Victivallales bacterium]
MKNNNSLRESLGTRLGFILLTAGCAIGLGNIWRFPFICGQYGGAIFVLIYLFFLVVLGFPVMVMELSLGRASRCDLFGAYKTLGSDKRIKWHYPGAVFFSGNIILMIFYTTVSGWMIAYSLKFASGTLSGLDSPGVGKHFGEFLADPGAMIGFMTLTVAISTAVCAIGLRNGVERITKILMAGLFLLLIGLCIRALFLPGAAEGLKFYLFPNLDSIRHIGLFRVVIEAMNQAFFTLSLGVGSIAIFGSYIDRTRTLPHETLAIIALDTTVAILSGVIIFPACFSFGVNPGSGPGLVFVSLPNVFNVMHGGRIWGTLFFLFMSFAALTTVVAVFENIIAFQIDELKFSRKIAALTTGIGIAVLSLPCALGFNLLSHVHPLGGNSTFLDLEDYIVSGNLLPLGSLCVILFCTSRYGWGWKNFLAEANAGRGMRFPAVLRIYVSAVIPVLILLLFLVGFFKQWAN